jgi:hypothetical protein
MKKKLHEITDEELLASLSGEDLSKPVEFQFDNPVASFVQAFDIRTGKQLVADKLLLTLFKEWKRDSPINQRSFNMQLENYVVSVPKKRRYFLINKDALEIAKEVQKLVQKRSKPRYKSKAYITHFESFLSENELAPGSTYVEIDVLYYIYNRWCDNNRKKSQFGLGSFNDMCSLYFDIKQITGNDLNWVCVNSKVKELITKEEVQRWRLGRSRHAKNKETTIPRIRYRKNTLHFQKKTYTKK